MKIVIVNGYVRENHGDAALISVLLTQLRQLYPDAELVIASMEDPGQRPTFQGAPNVGSLRQYSADESIARPKRIVRKFMVLCIERGWSFLPDGLRRRTLQWLPKQAQGELEAIETCDILISVGGGYMNSSKGIGGSLHLWYALLPLKLAHRRKKVVMFGPQSFGPFGNRLQKRHAVKILNNLQRIFVRETISLELLKKMGVRPELLSPAIDSGFAFIDLPRKRTLPSIRRHPRIGITARKWFGHEAQNRYETALAQFITYATEKYGAEVVLIPEVATPSGEDDDRIVQERIAQKARKLGGKAKLIETAVLLQSISDVYGSLDYMVGTRFHSVIFSLTCYVPAIAIEYEHKTRGIMRELDLEEWTIKIENLTGEDLNTLFDRLVVKRDGYVDQLMRVLPMYVAKTAEVPEIIGQDYARLRPVSTKASRKRS